jgi:hypothetical protein
MFKSIVQVILSLSVMYGCGTIKNYDNGIYINSKNGHTIELLESKKFIYTSYDGMQGIYYSYGDWEKTEKILTLKNRKIEPYIEINVQPYEHSVVTITDYRFDFNKKLLSFEVNYKSYMSSEIVIDEPIYSIIVKNKIENNILKELNLEKGNYKIDIKVSETLNEISIDTLVLNIYQSYLIDKERNRFERKK